MFRWIRRIYQEYKNNALTKHLSTNVVIRIVRLMFFMFILVIINSSSMVILENMTWSNAIWLSFTTLTTVGYGDYSPQTIAGRAVTIITMFGFAIALLSLLVGEIIDWRLNETNKKKNGMWKWKAMKNHIQIINTPKTGTVTFLTRLITEIQKTPVFNGIPVQLLSQKFPDGLPHALSELKVLHRTGIVDSNMLNEISLDLAQFIVILAKDAYDSTSDSITFDVLSQVVEINPTAKVVVEAVLDRNRKRFLNLGACAVLRPIRAYPEMIARAMSHPGTEKVLEDLFETHGNSLHKIPVKFSDLTWKDIVNHCMQQRVGTPLAYFNGTALITQPAFDDLCQGDALVVLANETNNHTIENLNKLLK